MNDQKQSPQADRDTQGAATTGVQYISVGEHANGQRLDNFLMSRLRGLPKSHLYSLIRKGAGEGGYRELAHRLDKETSGCLLVAKSAIVLKTLQTAFKNRQVNKTYQAIVHGSWPAAVTQVDAPLLRIQPQQGERIVKTDDSGKSALTEFRLLEDYGLASLIEARPLTGRTHQIRVHCQQAGHPILGDDKYTYHRPHSFGKLRFLCLHASALSLDHPVTGQTLAVSAPLRSAMRELLTQLDESRA